MKLSVVVPTSKRPDELGRCLQGLAEQQRPPDQVIVVMREGDEASVQAASRWQERLPLQMCFIAIPGVIQALNLALDQVNGDIVTITDDDTYAMSDWLGRIEAHFQQDPRLGGLGGRDLLYINGDPKPVQQTDDEVGVIKLYGRVLGNHHTGRGPARDVDHLKGVNMSWRMAAIGSRRFPTELRGAGAQVYFELAFSLAVQGSGWKLVYDPAIQLEHTPAQRFDSDKRVERDAKDWENSAFNLYTALRRYMRPGLKRSMALWWVHYVGVFGNPGILRGLLFRLRGDREGIALRKIMATAWKEAKDDARIHDA